MGRGFVGSDFFMYYSVKNIRLALGRAKWSNNNLEIVFGSAPINDLLTPSLM